MRKIIASTTIAASMIGGGAGAIMLAPTMAGAQEAGETAEATEPSGLAAVLAELVEDNTLSQTQADAVAEAVDQAREDGRLGHRGHGHHGRGGPGWRGAGDVFEELDIDADVVREGLADGETLGEIAEANGSSAEALASALSDQMNERLDEAVANDRIDEERAAELRAGIDERVDDIVNGEAAFGRKGPGHRFRGAPDGDGAEAEGTGA